MKIFAFVMACGLLSVFAPRGSYAQVPDEPEIIKGLERKDGLLPAYINKALGRIVVSLPAPDADGIAARFIYTTALRTAVGSNSIGLDRAKNVSTQLLAFRRIGNKIAIQFENPRFRATGAPTAEQAAARDSFAITTAWLGKIEPVEFDGRLLVEISPFLTRDIADIAGTLAKGGAKGFRLKEESSAADPGATKVFTDNIELEALQTYSSDTPGDEIENIAPDPRQISVVIRHSLIRLPDPGYPAPPL